MLICFNRYKVKLPKKNVPICIMLFQTICMAWNFETVVSKIQNLSTFQKKNIGCKFGKTTTKKACIKYLLKWGAGF